jgi:hypothetical protein
VSRVQRLSSAGGEFAEGQLQVDQLLVARAQQAFQLAAPRCVSSGVPSWSAATS